MDEQFPKIKVQHDAANARVNRIEHEWQQALDAAIELENRLGLAQEELTALRAKLAAAEAERNRASVELLDAEAERDALRRLIDAYDAGIGILYCERIRGVQAIAEDGSHDWMMFAEAAREWAKGLKAERDAILAKLDEEKASHCETAHRLDAANARAERLEAAARQLLANGLTVGDIYRIADEVRVALEDSRH